MKKYELLIEKTGWTTGMDGYSDGAFIRVTINHEFNQEKLKLKHDDEVLFRREADEDKILVGICRVKSEQKPPNEVSFPVSKAKDGSVFIEKWIDEDDPLYALSTSIVNVTDASEGRVDGEIVKQREINF